MERLTWKHGLDGYTDVGLRDGVSVGDAICHLADYEDAMPLERAQELAHAEKDGRLVVLPCRIGDLYYRIEKFCDEGGELDEPEMHSMGDCEYCINPCSATLSIVTRQFGSVAKILCEKDYIGKTIFLNREEAEAALKKREEACKVESV